LIFSNILNAKDPLFLLEEGKWIDSLMTKMSIEEKIGQLIIVTSQPELGDNDKSKILEQIEKYNIGGVLFLQTSPVKLATLANNYQSVSKVPLFIALDGENGLSYRLDSTVRYPQLIGLGAIQDDSLLYRMGREIGQQCKTLGINVNFAPVGDVNSNPENPIINYRSFGEDPEKVSKKSWLLAKGMQDENVIVSLKHFPGHGDTSIDSHLSLPKIDRAYPKLDSVDFLPFKTCIDSGVNGIMSAHIYLSAVDTKQLPATLSKRIMTDILRDSLGFNGLVFSDGMNMKGISIHYSEGAAAVQALKAGVDVIEFVLHPENVIDAVVSAVRNGSITEKAINEKCRKVLKAKQWIHLNDYHPVKTDSIYTILNRPEYELTARKLTEQSLSVLKNENSLLPLQRLDTLKVASFSVGSEAITNFQKGIERYINVVHFNLKSDASPADLLNVLRELKNYNLVLAGIHGAKLSPNKKYKLTDLQISAINQICHQNKTVLCFFGNPYSISFFEEYNKAQALIIAYGETNIAQDYVSQLIFGAISATGKLPVSVNDSLKAGEGFELLKPNRLKYTIPEEVGINSNLLKSRIDSLVNVGLSDKYFPGCQVLVAKEGKVIFDESYGFHTYDDSIPVINENLYDLASVTKVAGPLPLLMKMYEDSVLKLDVPFSTYWSDFKHSNKASFTLREALAHQAQLEPGIAFHVDAMKKSKKRAEPAFSERPSEKYSVRVASNLYISNDYKKKMFSRIKDSKLLPEKKYTYSDLCFMLFPDVISNLTRSSYESYLEQNFLAPIGAKSVHYNPYRFYPKERFIPTERDDTFRKEVLQGFVHDEGAAMMGGVSGNAGLFSTANDLAKIMQFYLQKGEYGDLKLFSPKTFDEFNRVQYPENGNRRALGFDKPYLENSKKALENAYPAPSVSAESFGHTGYTGTFVWADPKNQLIVIFLSNRVYPTRENEKLIKKNFRPQLQQLIYDCEGSFSRKYY
jgi:beta-N-acetylhexosaminidase